MPEPKIDPDLSFVATAGGDPDAYVSPALQQRFDALAAENAGLREAAGDAEKALAEIALELVPPTNRVTYDLTPAQIRNLAVARLAGLREALAAARPVVEAAREIAAWGDMPTTLMWVRLTTAVDSYTQSSNPGETS